jgi:hypothetical protein
MLLIGQHLQQQPDLARLQLIKVLLASSQHRLKFLLLGLLILFQLDVVQALLPHLQLLRGLYNDKTVPKNGTLSLPIMYDCSVLVLDSKNVLTVK